MNAEIWKKKTNPKQIKTGKLNKNGEISTKSFEEESEVQISMRLVNIDDVDTIVK